MSNTPVHRFFLLFTVSLVLAGCASVPEDKLVEEEPEELMKSAGLLADIPAVTEPPGKIARQQKTAKSELFGFVESPVDTDKAASEDMKVHILNIGSGSCQIVDCPSSDDVLVVDCGSMSPSETDLEAAQIKSYFNEVIGKTGDVKVTLSHPHEDHINQIENALNGKEKRIKSIWVGGKLNDYGGGAERLINKVAKAKRPIKHGWKAGYKNGKKPVSGLSCGAADTYILTVNSGSSTNANSMMLMVEYEGFSIVFSGDAEGVTENAALKNFGDDIREVTVVTSSHHGARSYRSNNVKWIEHLAPKEVIYSSGTKHGHPYQEVVELYRETISRNVNPHSFWSATSKNSGYTTIASTRGEYVTELNGAVIITTDGETYSIECTIDENCGP